MKFWTHLSLSSFDIGAIWFYRIFIFPHLPHSPRYVMIVTVLLWFIFASVMILINTDKISFRIRTRISEMGSLYVIYIERTCRKGEGLCCERTFPMADRHFSGCSFLSILMTKASFLLSVSSDCLVKPWRFVTVTSTLMALLNRSKM